MRNNDISFRAFVPETDTLALSRIWLDASLIAHAFIGEQRLLEQQVLIETQYLPGAESWVACIGDAPAGFISLLDTFVGGIFVAPQRQGLGIGRKLITHALNLKGELSLEVYTRNTGAMNFYASLGFEEVSRRASDDDGLPFENALLRLTK